MGIGDMWGNAVLSYQFCCGPKTVVKKKKVNKVNPFKNTYSMNKNNDLQQI